MSHHSANMRDLMDALFDKATDQSKQLRRERELNQLFSELGPTGRHPDGLMTAGDEGGLKMAVTSKDEKVILAFGTPTAWVGFNPSDARALAKSLSDHADNIEREQERQAGRRP